MAVCTLRRVDTRSDPPGNLESLVEVLTAERGAGLTERQEARRLAARDMLRYGKFKPTGRSKPASEYLLSLARKGEPLPVVLPAVDAANYISLKYLAPVSIWDVDKMPDPAMTFRTGRPDESYVFNRADQLIDLRDLVCGCACSGSDDAGEPIVNPIKDSMQTKLSEETRLLGFVMYAPTSGFSDAELRAVLDDTRTIFDSYVGFHQTGAAVLKYGESADLP